MIRRKVSEPLIVKAIRIITGIVFIFSSVVKGVDPLGTDYRVIDYLDAYGWYFLMDYSFIISILLISAEFLIGVALLFKLRSRLAALGVLLIMAYFTVVTYIDARYELVPDCGCFGDAVKLTNWETFYKNIVLMIFAIIIFVYRSRMAMKMRIWLQFALLAIMLGLFNWFMMYNYAHLPVWDFRDWKVGNDMKSTGQETVISYLAYKNKETGEIKEYISPDYPWNDSVWMSEWEFVNQRIDDSKLVLKHGLIIEDEEGNNYTNEIVENPGYQFILSVYDIQEADPAGMKKATEVYRQIMDSDVGFAMLTSSDNEEVNSYSGKYGIDYDVYLADDIELKAMIRSNPGMVLLKNGVVLKKWHHNDIPEPDEVKGILSQ